MLDLTDKTISELSHVFQHRYQLRFYFASAGMSLLRVSVKRVILSAFVRDINLLVVFSVVYMSNVMACETVMYWMIDSIN